MKKWEQITMFEVIAGLEGNGTRPSHKGSGINNGDVSFTLNATEQHAIACAEVSAPLSAADGPKGPSSQQMKNPEENFALEQKTFGICSQSSNSMKSDNPHSGIYEADTTKTLDLNGGNPGCNQGGMAIVEHKGIYDVRITSDGTKVSRAHCYPTETSRCLDTSEQNPDSNHGGVAVIEYQDVVGTLAASDYKFPQQQQVEEGKCIVERAIDDLNRDAPHQQDLLNYSEGIARTLAAGTHGAAKHLTKTVVKGQTMEFENNSFGGYKETGNSATLKANGADFQGGEALHESNYMVRRLTPIECERLQGMPDMWCYGTEHEDLTDEELDFWLDAFETHRKIVTHATKPKTEKQVRKWCGKPLGDSPIYKIEGNGIALPNAWFVLSGLMQLSEE